MAEQEQTIKERLNALQTFIEADVPGFGRARFRKISVDRMIDLAKLGDEQFAKAVLAESLVEADGSLALTAEEIGKMAFADMKPLREMALQVNSLRQESAEKKSGTPPSSTSSATSG